MQASQQQGESGGWRWWQKLLLGFVVLITLVLIAASVALYAGHRYLISEKIKTFDNIAVLNGASLSFGPLRGLHWRDYPHFTLQLGNVYLDENARHASPDPLLELGHAQLKITVNPWSDTIAVIHAMTLRDGLINILFDSTGSSNMDRIFKRSERTQSTGSDNATETNGDPTEPKSIILDPNFSADIYRAGFCYVRPEKENLIDLFIDSLALSELDVVGGISGKLALTSHVAGLQFKAREGSYLRNGMLQGVFAFRQNGERFDITAPGISISDNQVDFSAIYYPNKSHTSKLTFAISKSVLAKARSVLTQKLQRDIARYEISDTFSTVTNIYLPTIPSTPAYVEIDVKLRGNDAVLDKNKFYNAYLDATFINRLPGVDTFFQEGPKGLRFEVDTVSTKYVGFDVTSANGLVVAELGDKGDIFATMSIKGSARDLSTVLKNEDFQFTQGTMTTEARVRGPLDNLNGIIDQSDFEMQLDDLVVNMVEAGSKLPLKQVKLNKLDQTATFDVFGLLNNKNRSYRLEGTMTGAGALLYNKYTVPTHTDVKLTATHIAWRDVVTLLGVDTTAAKVEEAVADQPTADSVAVYTSAEQVQAMKAALTRIQKSFDPNLDVYIDTISYYGMSVHDLKTGIHFDADNVMTLERTSFKLDTGLISFSGRLNIGESQRTPFNYQLRADHLNIDALLPQLDYLGQEFLQDIENYPNDVNLRAEQEGYIDDEDGLVTGTSSGLITLKSNKRKAFEAEISFEPDDPADADHRGTRVSLTGSPSLFNEFFQTEDFIFNQGNFAFDMSYSGLVPDIRTLVDQERMSLRVDGTNVLFRTLGVSVPLTHLALDMNKDIAGLDMLLFNESLGQELRITGSAISVSEVVLGSTGKQFSADVKVTSPRLVWKDLRTLIGQLTDSDVDTTVQIAEATAADAEVVKSQSPDLRTSIRELMRRFQPTVAIEIDELKLNKYIDIRNVQSGLYMTSKDRLYIDTTGFDYLDGEMELYGSIDLRDLSLTPFQSHLSTKALDLAAILEGFEYFDMQSLREADQLSGVLSMNLDASGAILGDDDGQLLTSATRGTLDFNLSGLEVAGLSMLDTMAAKFKVRDRMDILRFAPIRSSVQLYGDSIYMPLTEVQSNAFNFFVEGDYTLGKSSDVWVSVPLYNLKKPNLEVIPDKRGWSDSRFKIHMALQQLKDSDKPAATKIKLSKRKYYKKAGRLDEWRELRK